MTGWASFVDVLRTRAGTDPDLVAFRYLDDGVHPRELTYGGLDAAARRIAVQLREQADPSDRAILLFAPGLDYVEAFFGCVYAGIVAVPAYPPLNPQQAGKLLTIIGDADPALILSTEAILPVARDLLNGVAGGPLGARWVATDASPADPDDWAHPGADGDTVAFLQYTSGTTGDPKGVVVSHANLLANSEFIGSRFGHTRDSSGVIWLPPYHDMGLIGGILQPVHGGFPVALMSPLDFLHDPMRWLQAITEYAGTTSGGPNFAFDLCVRKIPAERRGELDLSSWTVAFTGAEPVRDATMRAFTDAFAPAGFRREAFYPCYGLAEATLMVAGGFAGQPSTVLRLDPDELSQGSAVETEASTGREIVGCGTPADGHDVRIVDLAGSALPDGQVGEIWVRGPSVSSGYWSVPAGGASRTGELAGDPGRPYLRTGDLGFRRDGELFPTGRKSDLVIIRGRNYAPADIELTVAGCDSRIRAGCGAAFTVDTPTGAVLCLTQEVDGRDELAAADAAALIDRIRGAVAEAHGLAVDTVALTARGTLPKTSSGKLRRNACRDALLGGTLTVVAVHALGGSASKEVAPAGLVDAIRAAAARVIGTGPDRIEPDRIDPDRPLTGLGLDSVNAVELRALVQREAGLLLPLPALLGGASCAELARLAEPGAGPTADATGPELTKNESAIWFLQQFAPDSRAYHLCHAADIHGPISDAALDRAVELVTRRHAAFRTTFPADGGQSRRVVGSPSVRVRHVDGAGWDDARIDAHLAALADETIDLGSGPLWRLEHLALGADRHVLALATHHLVADLWSLTLVVRELLGHLAGTGDADLPEARSMRHVAAAEGEYLASEAARADAAAWRERLGDAPALVELPTDRPRSAVQSFRGAAHDFGFDRPTTEDVHRLARAMAVTPYTVLLGSLYCLLRRHTGSGDLVVGAPAPGRGEPSSHDVVGMLVNTLPVRCLVASHDRFRDVVTATAEQVRATMAAQRYPFAELVRQRQASGRDASRNPLFDIVLGWHHAPGRDPLAAFGLGRGRIDIGGLSVDARAVPVRHTPFDLNVDVVDGEDGLDCHLRYNADLWDRQSIADLVGRWQQLLAAACTDPDAEVRDLPLVDPTEHRQLLRDLAPATGQVAPRLLDDAVGRWAELTPHAVAVEDDTTVLSYAELEARIARGGAWLRALGVRPEVRVALLVRRSAAFVVAALTVLRAGGTFVPLDPDHPTGRLARQVRDSDPLLIVTDGESVAGRALAEELGHDLPRVIEVGDGTDDASPPPVADGEPARLATPRNAAYVMYTSGTTGVPKGVCVPTSGVVNLLDDIAERAPVGHGARCAWWTNAAFDLSVYEIFTALEAGAALVVVPQRVHTDGPAFADWIAERRIAGAYVPLFAVDALADRAERALAEGRPLALRRLMVGVEPVPLAVIRRLASAVPGMRILNAYGPTEATIVSAMYDGDPAECEGGAIAPIGRGVRNGPLYLLDADLVPVPLGVNGEIYVGGVGVTRGYLGRAAATAERFVPDPWVRGARMYRTGDFGRWGRDHELRFAGRRDSQVKLRGVRIELGEVESVLRHDPRVRAAVATVREVNGSPLLVGYVVADPDEALTVDLITAARRELPGSMVPASVVRLDALPMTESGKLDRTALPLPALRPAGYEPPRDDLEQAVAGAWAQLLDLPRIGRNDDFFALGGHSVLAAQSAVELGHRLGRDVPVALLFSHSTVAALAQSLHAVVPARAPIAALPRPDADLARLRAQVLSLPDDVVAQLLDDGIGAS